MSTQPIVLGLYGCVDYLTHWSDETMRELVKHEGVALSDLPNLRSHPKIRNQKDLLASILAHMQAGVGGEQALPSLEVAESLSHAFGFTKDVGGTSVRAARALAGVGVSARLGLSNASPTYNAILPDSIEVHTHRWIEEEYPHLIIQYPAGARIPVEGGVVESPNANRLIYVYDPVAAILEISPNFEEYTRGAKVLSLSALNTVSDRELLDTRLARMQQILKQRDEGCFAVFEDGAYHVPEFSALVARGIGPLVDMYSMNEDEFQAHIGRDVNLGDANDVATGLAELLEILPAPVVAVHTARWAAAVGTDSERIATALLAGQALAAARVAHGDNANRASFDAMVAAGPQADVLAFAQAVEEHAPVPVRCVPGRRVDVPNPTTIGLGDTFLGGVVGSLAGELRLAGGQQPRGGARAVSPR